jgi:hypothetical protein
VEVRFAVRPFVAVVEVSCLDTIALVAVFRPAALFFAAVFAPLRVRVPAPLPVAALSSGTSKPPEFKWICELVAED